MLRATSTGAAQICGGDGVGVGDAAGDGVALADVLADVLALAGGDPLAGWLARDADDCAPAATAGCLAGPAGAELACGTRAAVVFVAGEGTVLAVEGIVERGASVEAGVVGVGDAVGAGASRWQAAMMTVFPVAAALPPMPLTSAK